MSVLVRLPWTRRRRVQRADHTVQGKRSLAKVAYGALVLRKPSVISAAPHRLQGAHVRVAGRVHVTVAVPAAAASIKVRRLRHDWRDAAVGERPPAVGH